MGWDSKIHSKNSITGSILGAVAELRDKVAERLREVEVKNLELQTVPGFVEEENKLRIRVAELHTD